MTGNLNISTSLYPSLYLLPSQNGTTNQTVFEGSYLGASSFSSWEDGTGNNRRMLEVRNAAYQASLDYAVMLRTCINGAWGAHRIFHAGMSTPGSHRQRRHRGDQRQGRAFQSRHFLCRVASQHGDGWADLPCASMMR